MASMKTSEVLADAFGRIGDSVAGVLKGLGAEALNRRPGGTGNSIAWLVWHLTRVQDSHIADAAGREQVWISQGFAARFGFDLAPAGTGYGHSPAQASRVRVDSGELLAEYHRAVLAVTLAFVADLDGPELDRVVDTAWDPPVTLGVRLVSVLQDCLMHAGQAAYVRGLGAL
jgi:uncharacterized damage-inducible protein DinB